MEVAHRRPQIVLAENFSSFYLFVVAAADDLVDALAVALAPVFSFPIID